MRRSVSLAISLLGALVNFAFAVQLLSAWRSLRWEPESEWEGSENSWRGDGVKLVWGLLSGYFAVAATICVVGFVGIVKVRLLSPLFIRQTTTANEYPQSIPSYVRFYRDYSIADFSFCTLFTLFGTYASFRRSSVRAIVCDELSRQPDLMRDMAEMGLSLENCEMWFERAVFFGVIIMVVLSVIRVSPLYSNYKFKVLTSVIVAVTLPDCLIELLHLPIQPQILKSPNSHSLALPPKVTLPSWIIVRFRLFLVGVKHDTPPTHLPPPTAYIHP